jgi:two-component system, sporulation sensor kinase D
LREDRAIYEWVGSCIDITELKQAEEILKRDKQTLEKIIEERTQKLIEAELGLGRAKRLSDIGTLATTVAHELRNPLASIRMATANMKEKRKNDAAFNKYFQMIEKKIVESGNIINNLLFYSKIRTSQQKNVYICDVVRESLKGARKQSGKNVDIEIKCGSGKKISIETDPAQMGEVFHNIAANAIDAIADKRGKIKAQIKENEGSITIRISDNGTGIDEEHLKKVFDPFFTTKAKGTGLGLAVCRQIINLHGGTIDMESELNKGTTVIITLPRKGTKNLNE